MTPQLESDIQIANDKKFFIYGGSPKAFPNFPAWLYYGMNFVTLLKPGMKGEASETVTAENTAESLGSGSLPVYATPYMAALMESASVAAVDALLPPGFSTVGTELNIKHIAATPPGMTARAAGELLEIDGRSLLFQVKAWDDAGKIGEGVHRRFIVENEKFLRKTREKKLTTSH
jgi:predicted thioesterase